MVGVRLCLPIDLAWISVMPRAFLSYSSDDETYVNEVAERLGRYQAHIDSRSFPPGEDFRDSIRRALDDSDALVLFVSTKSLSVLVGGL